MKLSKAKAKKIGIEIWDYLAKHPEIARKSGLPKNLYAKIINFLHDCPLCEHFLYKTGPEPWDRDKDCTKCPLWNCSKKFYAENGCACKDYLKWENAKSDKIRAKYAAIIRDKIKEW